MHQIISRMTLAIACSLAFVVHSAAQERPAVESQNTQQVIDIAKWNVTERANQIQSLATHLDSAGMPPVEYVVDKFKTKDIVFFGEVHLVRENCEFVASLIKPLHEAGVHILFFEFIPTRFNARVQAITTAETFDQDAAIEVFRQHASPLWGYHEYLNIVKSVWQFNHTLGADQPKFRLIGLDDDWTEAELLKSDAEQRFKIILNREQHMTRIVREEALDKNQKGLVHIGYAHTVRHGVRIAAELDKSHPGRTFQVAAHHELASTLTESEITKCIEDSVEKSRFPSVGFDIVSSAFAPLRDGSSRVFNRLGPDSTLSDYAQGYVYLKSLSELTSVTWIDGFITDATFADALIIAKRKRWVTSTVESAQQLDREIASYFASRDKKSTPKQSTPKQ